MGYLDEAFKDLHELEDGVDLQDEQEVKKAIAFMNGDEDNLAQLELIVDADADSEEDIKDSSGNVQHRSLVEVRFVLK